MTLPDNPSPLASSNLESSSTTYPHPCTTSQPRPRLGVSDLKRCVRHDILLVQNLRQAIPSHRSLKKKRCSLVLLEHEPPHKATRATIPRTGRHRSKPIIPSSMKSSADVQVEILSDDRRRIVKRRLLELRYKSVPLGAMLKVGINQSSQTPFFC